MIGTEVALIMTVGGIAGSILVSQMWQMNWFKRENFKYRQSIDRKENSIRFKKMERDLGLKAGSSIKPNEKGLLESLQGLDPAIIAKFLGPVQKEDSGEEYDDEVQEKPDITETIMEMVKKDPSLVDKFLKGMGGKGEETQGNYL